MIKSAEHAPTLADSVVRNTSGKRSKQTADGPMPDEKLRELCNKYYNQLLPLMAEKVHQEKLQESCDKKRKKPSPSTMSRCSYPSQSPSVFSRLKHGEPCSFRQRSPDLKTRLTECMRMPGETQVLGEPPETRAAEKERQENLSKVRSLAPAKGKEKLKENGTRLIMQTAENPLRMRKDISLKLCQKTDPFTLRIRNFEFPKRIRMPSNVKTYDKSKDPEDHLKIFQTAAKVERWVMQTWCHMSNSMLIGLTRLWFDELLPESIDSYIDLRKAFLANFLQQKKYIKDLVEIHHIKKMEGESTEAFMERFKAKSMHVKGAPECMRVSEFMHGITNPDLIKRLDDNIPKSVDEMMSVTTAFLRREVVVENQSRKKGPTS
ncbi:reverse transcriptase domain-containing protein [Tanacetum coccineum]